MIDLELSLCGVLRNFGLKQGPVSKGRFDARVRELVDGNAILQMTARSCAPAPHCAQIWRGSSD